MATILDDIYEKTIKPLPAPDRLRLATRILNELPPEAMVDYRTEWSEEDYRDFAAASWAYVNQTLEEEEKDD